MSLDKLCKQRSSSVSPRKRPATDDTLSNSKPPKHPRTSWTSHEQPIPGQLPFHQPTPEPFPEHPNLDHFIPDQPLSELPITEQSVLQLKVCKQKEVQKQRQRDRERDRQRQKRREKLERETRPSISDRWRAMRKEFSKLIADSVIHFTTGMAGSEREESPVLVSPSPSPPPQQVQHENAASTFNHLRPPPTRPLLNAVVSRITSASTSSLPYDGMPPPPLPVSICQSNCSASHHGSFLSHHLNGIVTTSPSASLHTLQPPRADVPKTASPALSSYATTPSYRSSAELSTSVLPLSVEEALSEASSSREVVRHYQNRDHIFSQKHKKKVQADLQKARDEMVDSLYRIERSRGYHSDMNDFKSLLEYRQRLETLTPIKALSPSPSLSDLRQRDPTFSSNRRHSISNDEEVQFLKRYLDKARQTLQSPKPPAPYTPSLELLKSWQRRKDEEIERRLRPQLPSSLPQEDELKVDAMLKKRGVVSKFAREQVTHEDLARLKPRQWLNDEIINFYGAMILARSEGCKENTAGKGSKKKPLNVHYFSTFFWPKLTNEGYEKARLAKWTRKFDIFQKDVVLIPINHNNSHWTAAAINFRQKRIEAYDSMSMPQAHIFKYLRSYLDAEHKNKKKKAFDFSDWIDYWSPDTPQQENGYDCGVFTCQFLESVSRGVEPFVFSQVNIPYLRREMIWEIGSAALRDKL